MGREQLAGPLVSQPWHSEFWPEIVKTAERGGHTAAQIIEEVGKGHAMGWPVDGGFLVLCRSEDDRLVIWIGVGRGVRQWCGQAEKEISEFARAIGCVALRIEGRRGWRRILQHWSQDGERLELSL